MAKTGRPRREPIENPKTSYDVHRPTSLRMSKALATGDIEEVKSALTVMQRRFCEEYSLDYNATAACRRVGYAPKWIDRQASMLLHNEGCQYYIEYLTTSKAAKITSVDPDYVITRVMDIVNKDDAKDGDRLRGLELLARHLGMLRDKTEISGPDGKALEIEQRTREEVSSVVSTLKAMSKKSLRVVGGTDTDDDEDTNDE